MEYTWTLVSNADDPSAGLGCGGGDTAGLLNCNVQGPHAGQILILSNEPSAPQSQGLPEPAGCGPPPEDADDYAVAPGRMHAAAVAAEPRKLHLVHGKSAVVQ